MGKFVPNLWKFGHKAQNTKNKITLYTLSETNIAPENG